MFEPTVDNLYHIMKDMTVKPSLYKKDVYTQRANHLGYCFYTILNIHKDFVIAQPCSDRLRISISEYKYNVWVPMALKYHRAYTVRKYA